MTGMSHILNLVCILRAILRENVVQNRIWRSVLDCTVSREYPVTAACDVGDGNRGSKTKRNFSIRKLKVNPSRSRSMEGQQKRQLTSRIVSLVDFM
jgi:hypothetical protein